MPLFFFPPASFQQLLFGVGFPPSARLAGGGRGAQDLRGGGRDAGLPPPSSSPLFCPRFPYKMAELPPLAAGGTRAWWRMAIRDASILHFTVMFPPEAPAAKGSGKLPVVPRLSEAGWRWKPLAIPEASPGFSAATEAEDGWVRREGPAGSSEGKTCTHI